MARSKVSQALAGVPEQEFEDEFQEERETEPELKKKLFNVDNYKISSVPETRTLSIDGAEFEITVKPLSWSARNQILSRSLKWDSSGGTSFDGDAYVRECLKEMIVDAPWGRTTESFLISIDHRLGAVLEDVVPKAFEDNDLDVNQIKKG